MKKERAPSHSGWIYLVDMQEIGNSQICRFVQSREGKGRVHRADVRIWLGLRDFTVLGEKEAFVTLRSRT